MNRFRFLGLCLVTILLAGDASAATRGKRRRPVRKSATRLKARVTPAVLTKDTGAVVQHTAYGSAKEPVIRGGPWLVPTRADSTRGDTVDGEDLVVRRAAVEALGSWNGSAVVVDPNSGRILTVVNQKVAFGTGFQPCSTIKVAVSLAALCEKLVSPYQRIRIFGGANMTMTYALAHSNNYYFANMGLRMGFDRFAYYARLFGYGEKAGLNIAAEQPGHFPAAEPANGGVGMLTSFGEEIQQTPLQLAALMVSIANGGTMYYLQYPKTLQEAQRFTPQVKRNLPIKGGVIDQIKPGLLGAVELGTARRAKQEEKIAGKTGTCSQDNTHLGWFGAFNDVGKNKLVVVVLLTGGRPAIGPAASGVAGQIFKRLQAANYIVSNEPVTNAGLVSAQNCCGTQ